MCPKKYRNNTEKKKITKKFNFYQIKRNKLKTEGNQSSSSPRFQNSDSRGDRTSNNNHTHINGEELSHDSSEYSYTEVKLGQNYNESLNIQNNLKDSIKKRMVDTKFNQVIKGVMRLDYIKG